MANGQPPPQYILLLNAGHSITGERPLKAQKIPFPKVTIFALLHNSLSAVLIQNLVPCIQEMY